MLDISPILLLGSGLVFLLVLARLNSCLYKPLFKHMDDRDLQIKTDTENSRSNATEVEGMLEDKYNQFINTLADDKVALEKSLVSNMPLFKEGLKAKLSTI